MVGIVLGGSGKDGVILPTLSNPAVAGNVLKDKDFINAANERVVGTITSKSAQTYTPSTAAQTIAAGQYLSGAQTINAIPSSYARFYSGETTFANSGSTLLEISTPFAANYFYMVYAYETPLTYTGSNYTMVSFIANRIVAKGVMAVESYEEEAVVYKNPFYYGQIAFSSSKITVNLDEGYSNLRFSKGIYHYAYVG